MQQLMPLSFCFYSSRQAAASAGDQYVPSAIEDSMFREIVDTTGGGLAQFIAEYEKLQQALRKSHESETRYAARARAISLNGQSPWLTQCTFRFVFPALSTSAAS
jgi:hypothetical protein